MSNYLPITPQTEDYMRPSAVFENLTYNTVDLIVNTTADVTFTENPFIALDGTGMAYLQGTVTIGASATPVANFGLCYLPANLVPARDTHFPICVLRSGAYVANAVKVDQSTQLVLLKTQPQIGDIICLDNVAFLVETYN